MFALFACTKEEFLLSPVPKIRLSEVAPDSVTQFIDSIKMVIEYEDGDGDIGFFNPDSLSISVHDRRLSNPDFYYVSPLTPNGDSLSIIGSISIVIRNTFLLGNGNSETTNYQIKLKDRAGHWSNTVTTPDIVILK